jgi:hypothetical protein
MQRNTRQSPSLLNRRAALGGVGAAAAALGLGHLDRAAAQNATPITAGHPLVGTWLIMSPPGATVATFAADGSAELGWAISYVDPAFPDRDVVFNTPGMGTWEPIDEHKAHFTVVGVLSDAKGTYLGTATLQGYPLVGAEGQTFTDNEPEGRITVRDAANAVVSDQGDFAAGVTATRMSPNSVVFPEGIPVAGTPTG